MTKLTLHERNANKGTERGKALLRESLQERGAGRGIVCDKNGKIIAGNKTYEQALELGIPIRFVDTDGKTLLVVQRTDLDLYRDAAARRLAYDDNRIAQLDLDWAISQIAEDLSNGVDLSPFFRDDELDRLIASLEPASIGTGDTDTTRNTNLHYNIMFADFAQQRRFYEHLRHLKAIYPDLETPGARVDAWLAGIMGSVLDGVTD